MTVPAPGQTEPDTRFTEPLYTLTEAARYLAVPANTLRAWAQGYERSFPDRPAVTKDPVVTALPGAHGRPRVPFVGLSEAMVLAAFRQCGLPMQRIRLAVRVLREEIGLEHALASKRVYSDGAGILYDFAERYAEDDIGSLVVLRPGQRGFHPIVANYLKRISHDDEGWARRLVLPMTKRDIIAVIPGAGSVSRCSCMAGRRWTTSSPGSEPASLWPTSRLISRCPRRTCGKRWP